MLGVELGNAADEFLNRKRIDINTDFLVDKTTNFSLKM